MMQTRMTLTNRVNLGTFSRHVWHDPASQAKWQKRLYRQISFVHELEIATVVAGFRRVTVQNLPADGFTDAWRTLTHAGLTVLPLGWVKRFQGYNTYHEPAPELSRDAYCHVVAGRTADDAWMYWEAYRQSDHATMGRLLGFPECCVEFFVNVWLRGGYTDPTWQEAEATDGAEYEEADVMGMGVRRLKVPSVFGVNPIPRFAGIRLSFHMPCRFDCLESLALAEAYWDLARRMGADEELWEAAYAEASWSALKGVAVVRLPRLGLDVVVPSVPCWPRHDVIARDGYERA